VNGTQPLAGFRWSEFPDGLELLEPDCLPDGFLAGGMACGIKADGAPDLGMVSCGEDEVASAVVLTTNAVAAAPVAVCREELDHQAIRAVVVTSGNANCATGEQGLGVAREIRNATASGLGFAPDEVAIAQTGVIGVQLDPGLVENGVKELVTDLTPEGAGRFAEAILTTDLGTKSLAMRCDGVTITAQAKGAGMIEPGLATMLCFIQTDAVLDSPGKALEAAVAGSFNRISVDGQMSTNDTVILQASGTSGRPLPIGLLEAITLELALAIVADGEGATRVCRIEVKGALDDREADRVARAVANSPLVKTALFGRDPNWGRVLQAAGAALAGDDLSALGESSVSADELAGPGDQVELAIDLARGSSNGHAYFSDLTPRYIEINAEYTT
jgi:glutamate N-acetyltransferase/amino-acid N-acetyltransferase